MEAQGALGLLREELASEEAAVRVNAVRRLPLVAQALGDAPHAREMLLMLAERLTRECDEDELLFGLADSLLRLAPYFRAAAVSVLERLLAVEETVVRDKARECFTALARQADRQELAGALAPAIIRLAQSDHVIARVSAVHLIAEVFALLGEAERRGCLERVHTLFTDESLMLRRALASKLGALARQLPRDSVLPELLPHLKALAADDSDQVKALAAEALAPLATLLAPEENKTHLVPLVIQLTSDKSWKVKLHLARQFAALAQAMGAELADASLVSIFSSLLRDPENEVRVAAVRALAPFARLLSADKLTGVLAHLASLARDSVPLVRVGVAEVLAAVLDAHGGAAAARDLIRQRALPLVQELLAERELEVKIEAVALLRPLARAIGQGVLELLAQAPLLDLESPQWRARLASFNALLELSDEFHSAKIFDRHFRRGLLLALRDRAATVRQAAVAALPRLATYLDPPMLTGLFRELMRASTTKDFYTYRVTALQGVVALAPVIDDHVLVREGVSKCLVPLVEDAVPNVRQAAVRGLIDLVPTDSDVAAVLSRAFEREKDAEVRRIIASRV